MEANKIKEILDFKALELNYNSIEEFIAKIIDIFEVDNYKLVQTYDFYEKEKVYNFILSSGINFNYDYNLNLNYSRNKKNLSLVLSEIKKPETQNDTNFILNRKVNIMDMDRYKIYYIIKSDMNRKNNKLIHQTNQKILTFIKSIIFKNKSKIVTYKGHTISIKNSWDSIKQEFNNSIQIEKDNTFIKGFYYGITFYESFIKAKEFIDNL